MTDARRQKLERQQAALEAAYRSTLLVALEDCASGHWGLFAQNAGTLPRHIESRFAPSAVLELDEIADELAAVRQSLGFGEPFELAARLRYYRAQSGQNHLGEPRLAAKFLEELKVSE